jgi:hypothetical protein
MVVRDHQDANTGFATGLNCVADTWPGGILEGEQSGYPKAAIWLTTWSAG